MGHYKTPQLSLHYHLFTYLQLCFSFFPEANMNVSFGYNDSDGLLGKDDQGQFIEFITEAQCFVLESSSIGVGSGGRIIWANIPIH